MADSRATLKQIVQYDIEYVFLSRGRQIRIASLTTDQVHFGSAVAVSVTDKLRDFSPEHYVLANVGVSHSSLRCRRPKQILISRVIFRDKDQINPAHYSHEFDGLKLDFKQI